MLHDLNTLGAVRQRGLLVAALSSLALVGCAHSAGGQDRSPADLERVTAGDLFAEGVAHAIRGDGLRAEQYLNAAQRRGHDADEVVAWLVRVCVASSRYTTALKHARTHLRVHPGDWWLRLVAASIHDALDDVSGALRELALVVETVPGESLAYYRLGLLYTERLGDPESAKEHFRHYLRLDPEGRHAAEVRAALDVGRSSYSGPARLPYPADHAGSVP